jgi:REase_DpnII-MboI
MWRTYADLAAARLSALAAYLQNKVTAPEREADSVLDLVAANLRPAMFADPSSERDVQDKLEVIFRARSHNFRREKVSIPYSSKYYVPDFTFDDLDLAVEVKLCKSDTKEKSLIDEINADILAYQTKYRRAIFVVYDLGFIRDVPAFKSGIESRAGVYVLVVKK